MRKPVSPKNGIDLGLARGVVEIDASKANVWSVTIYGPATANITNLYPGEELSLLVIQDGAGGHPLGFSGMAIDLAGGSTTIAAGAGVESNLTFIGVNQSGNGLIRLQANTASTGGGGGGGSVNSVTGTLPITSTGGANPNITINPATDSLPGSMSAADKAKLDGTLGAPIHNFTADPVVLVVGGTNVIQSGVVGPVTVPAGVTPGDEILIVLSSNAHDLVVNASGSDTINGNANFTIYGSGDPNTNVTLEYLRTNIWTETGGGPALPSYVAPANTPIQIQSLQSVGGNGVPNLWQGNQGAAGNTSGEIRLKSAAASDTSNPTGDVVFDLGQVTTTTVGPGLHQTGTIRIQTNNSEGSSTDKATLVGLASGLRAQFGSYASVDIDSASGVANVALQYYLTIVATRYNEGWKWRDETMDNGAGHPGRFVGNRQRNENVTSDAIPVDMNLWTPPGEGAIYVEAFANIYDATNKVTAKIKRVQAYYFDGGAWTLVGSINNDGSTDEGSALIALWTSAGITNPIQFDPSGISIASTLTGLAGRTLNWNVETYYRFSGA